MSLALAAKILACCAVYLALVAWIAHDLRTHLPRDGDHDHD